MLNVTLRDFRQSWCWPFLLLSIPAAVWFVIAVFSGYTLEGDRAHIAIRTFDVFSSNPPLLGMPTTAGNEVEGVAVFHPGPMQFLLMAPIYLLSGGHAWGLLLGALVVSLGLLALALWTAWRIGSTRVKVATVTSFALVMIPFQFLAADPWNPFPAAIGSLTLVVLIWGIAVGERGLWPFSVLVASLVAQTHVVGVVISSVILLALGALTWRFGIVIRSTAREVIAAVLVFIVVWALPLWDLLSNWPGNLGELTAYLVGSQGQQSGSDENVEPVLLSVKVALIFCFASVSLLGFRKAHRLRTSGNLKTLASDKATLAVGLFVCSFVIASGGIVMALRDVSRVFYMGLFFSIVPLLVVLLFSPQSIWWEEWTKGTFGIATVFVVGTLLVAPTITTFARNAIQNRPLVAEAQRIVENLGDVPILIEQKGGHVWISSGTAVVADFITSGREVYFEHFAREHDYDDWRRTVNAPREHLVLHIVQQEVDGTWPDSDVGIVLDQTDVTLEYSKVTIRLILSEPLSIE